MYIIWFVSFPSFYCTVQAKMWTDKQCSMVMNWFGQYERKCIHWMPFCIFHTLIDSNMQTHSMIYRLIICLCSGRLWIFVPLFMCLSWFNLHIGFSSFHVSQTPNCFSVPQFISFASLLYFFLPLSYMSLPLYVSLPCRLSFSNEKT